MERRKFISTTTRAVLGTVFFPHEIFKRRIEFINFPDTIQIGGITLTPASLAELLSQMDIPVTTVSSIPSKTEKRERDNAYIAYDKKNKQSHLKLVPENLASLPPSSFLMTLLHEKIHVLFLKALQRMPPRGRTKKLSELKSLLDKKEGFRTQYIIALQEKQQEDENISEERILHEYLAEMVTFFVKTQYSKTKHPYANLIRNHLRKRFPSVHLSSEEEKFINDILPVMRTSLDRLIMDIQKGARFLQKKRGESFSSFITRSRSSH